MKTLEQQVRELADREEIKELTAKYAHWVAVGEGAEVTLVTDCHTVRPQHSSVHRRCILKLDQ